MTRAEHDYYPTPESIVTVLVSRALLRGEVVWEPCAGDGRIVDALTAAGKTVIAQDIATGTDFFKCRQAHAQALVTNPPFSRIREFIDHAFAIGVKEMALVCPERLWACERGRKQFERHRPGIWANLSWREDYLGRGGSPDRALAVAIWWRPCHETCEYQIWRRP